MTTHPWCSRYARVAAPIPLADPVTTITLVNTLPKFFDELYWG
ncbi:MAG TPA: hypothetical protein VNB91_14925 [Jatrophihabitantaceae bacterium]|jgi:hypothetical protein|nr:hypothetical protein [Jatrophihabitantaceae bacterium]